jgi:hypothetical protein
VTGDTRLIVAGLLPATGSRIDKMQNTISPALSKFLENGNPEGIHKVEFLFKPSIDDATEALKDRVQEFIRAQQSSHPIGKR